MGTRSRCNTQRDALAHVAMVAAASARTWCTWDWRHALLNCAGLALLWVLFAREFPPRRWLWIVIAVRPLIDRCRPVVPAAGGRVVCRALRACCTAPGRPARARCIGAARPWAPLLLLLLIVKLVYEQQSGASLFDADLPLVTRAHLFGALGGLIGALLPRAAAKPL